MANGVSAGNIYYQDDGIIGARTRRAMDIAVSHVGVRETTGNNDGKEIVKMRYGVNNYAPWCETAVNYFWNPEHKRGQNLFGLSDIDVMSTQKVLKAAKKQGYFYSVRQADKLKPGMALVWRTDNNRAKGHTCIVKEILPDGSIVTIHGNNNDAVEEITYPSLNDAMIRINSSGEQQTLQGFEDIPRYYEDKGWSDRLAQTNPNQPATKLDFMA